MAGYATIQGHMADALDLSNQASELLKAAVRHLDGGDGHDEIAQAQVVATLAVERQLAAVSEGLDLIAYVLGEMERHGRARL